MRFESEKLYERACNLMPGGVNSPVRAFRAVGGTPLYFARAEGARVWDADGNEYIDYVNSWGANILGHANPKIVSAITDASSRGTSYGAPHLGEILLAEAVLDRVPGMERVRFVNSGTEASLAVLRLVRAATGRTKILKFAGNYHGAVDSLLAKAGSGLATFSLPDSAGVSPETTAQTLVARFNDLAEVERNLQENRGEVAAILVEPVAGNMGCIPPSPGFLTGLRQLADQHGVLLIFDEVMTGFRVSKGGATERYGVLPDLVCLGKVIGGGLPVGAYGGRKDLMDWIAPLGPVYQAGTLSGNPLAMAAGLAALQLLEPSCYDYLESLGEHLESGIRTHLRDRVQVNRVGSMISIFFTDQPVIDLDSAERTDRARFAKLFNELLLQGIYLPPSALEAWFLTTAHTHEDIDRTVEAIAKALLK